MILNESLTTLLHQFVVFSFALTGGLTQESQNASISAEVVSIDVPSYVEAHTSVEMAVTTQLPSSCFEMKAPSTRLDLDRNVVLVHARAESSQDPCDAQPSFQTRVVSLGRLPEGNYEIRDLKTLKRLSEFSVQKFEVSAHSGR